MKPPRSISYRRALSACGGRRGMLFAIAVAALLPVRNHVAAESSPLSLKPPAKSLLNQYCVDCHDGEVQKGGLDLVALIDSDLTLHADQWEGVVRKLHTRQMPPVGKARPASELYDETVAGLVQALDRAAAKHPNPGRTETFRRLNRTEYRNAIRDLLALDIDASALLPPDDSSHGFDNITVTELSPTLLNRYITAAGKISRLALGSAGPLGGETYRIAPDVTQEEHVEGLPPGTRGGALLQHYFPRDGEYEVQVRLARDRNEEVEGLREAHEVQVILDRENIGQFTVSPPRDKDFERVDAHLKLRMKVTAGPHQLGVTFLKNPSSLLETRRQPYIARYNMHRHPRLGPAIYQISVNGPYESTGPGETPSRRRVLAYQPAGPEDEDGCAQKIISHLMRRAYRRPVSEADLRKPMDFYRQAKARDGFEAGLESALAAVLVGPEFLFRMEMDPPGAKAGSAYRVGDLALASRLSFFLWSSIPDEELLAVAERGELHKPAVLEQQTRRMLADARALNLVRNFGQQWLHLRNLESSTPDLRAFPEFDDNLRQAFRRETELHLETLLREDRSVLDLLRANDTYLNERLARHYGIPNIYGSRFRRVTLDRESGRGGLLRQGSVLTVTSYATRTSPVLRGKWVLENVMGAPPPPPLPDVPALDDNTVSATLSVRERLAEHRANAACASCHNLMDPVGLALENFDAVGRWRVLEDGNPVDATGGLPDGSEFSGVAGLEAGLLKRPEIFAATLAEKLLTFALGRGVEHHDAPAVRKVVREAQEDDFRFSSIVVGITQSMPFTMRRSQ